MDYHPEIEALAIARYTYFRWIAKLLRVVDAFFLRRMDFAIVLDDAMERLIRGRAPHLPVIQHPTWNWGGRLIPEEGYLPVGLNEKELRFVYGGNLGYSHPLETLENLLCELKQRCKIVLLAVGASSKGEERLRILAERTGIALSVVPRTTFLNLGKLFLTHRIDAGVVLLSDDMAGLVSPSKFGAYLRFGIPTLYIGPAGTSSEAVCTRFGAGFFVKNGAEDLELKLLATRLCDRAELAKARGHTHKAAAYFGSHNGDTLACAIERFFSSAQ